jgi:poly-beta-hydroxyalkanoate depolymerase
MQAGVGHYGVFSGKRLEQRNLSAAAGFPARQCVI